MICLLGYGNSDHGRSLLIIESTSLVIMELFIHDVKIILRSLPPLLEPSVPS